jgi:Zn finger protein HypA/HybF involved in hydrogenase expression/very-short-patch-repair endonuclease
MTSSEFVVKAQRVHANRFDYSRIVYERSNTKVEIVCRDHGPFLQTPNKHLCGRGCPVCADLRRNAGRRLTTEVFVAKARKKHGHRFSYERTQYTEAHSKVCITCPVHGDFWQTPANHYKYGCRQCWVDKNPLHHPHSVSEFLCAAKRVHGETYSYHLVKYKRSQDTVRIVCPVHGEFEQRANTHLMGHGCPSCARELNTEALKHDVETFIEKARMVHGDKYTYEKSNYVNDRTELVITCREHGTFRQRPNNHLQGKGCPLCGTDSLRLSTDDFTRKAAIVHRGKYSYENTEYHSSKGKVAIHCPNHGEFLQEPRMHLSGKGCPFCGESKGEERVSDCLASLGLKFSRQMTFPDCKDKSLLRFDFYVPSLNLLVEYDGALHFVVVEALGGQPALEDTQRKDRIKTQYAEEKEIHLLRIPYWEMDSIEAVLRAEVMKFTPNSGSEQPKGAALEQPMGSGL